MSEGNKTEARIAELEACINFYQAIINSSHEWKFFQDHDGKILFSNNTIERITGFSKHEFMTGRIFVSDIVHPDDRDSLISNFQLGLQGQLIDACEHRIITSDNRILFCETTIIPVLSDSNKFAGICVSIKDISKKKIKEQAILNRLSSALLDQQATYQQLHTQEKILKRLGANLKNGVIFQANTGPDGFFKFTYLSEGAASIYGYSSLELLNDPSLYLGAIHEQDFNNDSGIYNYMYPNGQIKYIERIVNAKTGETKQTYVVADPTVLAEGLVCWDGIILEYSEWAKLCY